MLVDTPKVPGVSVNKLSMEPYEASDDVEGKPKIESPMPLHDVFYDPKDDLTKYQNGMKKSGERF